MAHHAQFASMPEQDAIDRLRVHERIFTAYALAMAQRAGLPAVEAADLFMQPLLPPSSRAAYEGTVAERRQWVGQEAAAMEAVHGKVRLERDGAAWVLWVDVARDLEWLQLWDVAPEYWVAWSARHVERVVERHDSVVAAALEGHELRLTFRGNS